MQLGLQVENLVKRFGGDTPAVAGVSFHAAAGEFVTLLGPSGCGKSTTLRCVAGLEEPAEGRISIGNDPVTDIASGIWVPPERRNIGMVFQSYALWPHLSVYENVAFPLRMRGWKRPEISKAVQEALMLVSLAGFGNRFPGTLSGGQQQRVALARGIVSKPRLLLFDEPLSNLDARLREQMRVEILRLQRQLQITTIYVTHDQGEAMAMSDRVIVMEAGRIHQIDSPRLIYERPRDPFVANFVGIANLVSGTVVRSVNQGRAIVKLTNQPDLEWELETAIEVAPGQAVSVLVRPENVEVVAPDDKEALVAGEIVEILYQGHELDMRVGALGKELKVNAPSDCKLQRGDRVGLKINLARCALVEELEA